MTVMPPSDGAPQVSNTEPTIEQVMTVLASSTDANVVLSGIRELFDGAPVSPSSQIRSFQEEIREVNLANGWYDGDRSFGDDIALLHSEVTEAYEAYRSHQFADFTAASVEPGTLAKPEGVGSEFADVFIRLLDSCERHGIDLTAETARKIAFNRTRGYRHGGKVV